MFNFCDDADFGTKIHLGGRHVGFIDYWG
ncbi:hypothetical protein [Fusibacter tunisiensis]